MAPGACRPLCLSAAATRHYSQDLAGLSLSRRSGVSAPAYLLDLLHQIDMAKMDPERPPWIFFQPVIPPTTPDATRFEDAFKQIGHKKVGGGPKTTEADEFLFCGNLGSGMLILRSRVRLIEPNESFYTCSAHRLRDSHVGRQGHWVDIRVHGECSDEDLALITRLAQEADTRPVVVSRDTRRLR